MSTATHSRCAGFAAVAAALALVLADSHAAADLTPEQRASFVLKPEFSDTFHGKADRLYLNGFWKFKEEVNFLKRDGWKIVLATTNTANPATDAGLEQGYFKPSFDASGWKEQLVPYPWNYDVEAGERAGRYRAFAGVGYYRTSFGVPAEKKGKRAFLHFDLVQTECAIWVNGQLAGRHVCSEKEFGTSWTVKQRCWLDEFDLEVSPFLICGGTNTLVLRVYDDGRPIMGEQFADNGGILGPVHLEFREEVHFPEILVAPDLDKSVVVLHVRAENYGRAPRTLSLEAEAAPFRSAHYTSPAEGQPSKAQLGRVAFPPGESRHVFELKMVSPVYWDMDCPFLYHLRLSGDGRLLGQTRFGFREFRVNGPRFELNRHPVYLRGCDGLGSVCSGHRIQCFNHANWLRHALRLYKEANIPFLRTHGSPGTRAYHDICDELGLMTENDFSPRSRELKPGEIQKAEQIAVAQVADYLANDGKGGLTGDFMAKVRQWVVRLHNSPSVCMFTGGNELGPRSGADEKPLAAYMDAFYDTVKACDTQKRPITPSSGLTVWQWHTPLKADYHDFHAYWSWEVGWHDMVSGNRQWWNHLQRIYGTVDKPAINGECVGHQSESTLAQDIRALWKENAIDRKAYVEWANRIVGEEPPGYWQLFPRRNFIPYAGIRSAVSRPALQAATADLRAKELHVFRRDIDFLEGYMAHDIDPAHWGLSGNAAFYTEETVKAMYEKCREHIEFKSLRDNMAPQIVSLDVYDRHLFAGDSLRAGLFVINNLLKANEQNLAVDVAVEDAQGRAVAQTTVPFEAVPEHARARKNLVIGIPEGAPTGDCVIRARLMKAGAVLNEQTYPLFVLAPREKTVKMASARKVALYEVSGAATGSISAASTRVVLDQLGIAHTRLEDFAKLDAHDVLIIGCNSMDAAVTGAGDRIRSWLEQGGRILCLEQSYTGPVPFAGELRIQSSGNMFFADLIEPAHPAVADSAPWHWDLWNGERRYENGTWEPARKRIYKSLVLPMPEGVVVSGGSRSSWGKNPIFGMVAGEVRIGKGLVFFSQAEATRRFETDPVAMRYLQNLLRYTLGPDWDGRYAAPVSGKRVSFLNKEDCFFVDLSAHANRAFTDETADDRQGGWTDDGNNDLRGIQRGDVVFQGIPYRILDDAGGKPACLMLRGNHRPFLPRSIAGIPVGRKAGKLMFLHASAWTDGENRNAGEYRIHYEDGTAETVPMVAGENIGDWWAATDLPAAKVACTVPNALTTVCLFSHEWKNPRPDKTIDAIDIVSAVTMSVPICVGITGVR